MKFRIVMGFGGPGSVPGESVRFVALGQSFLLSEEVAGLSGSLTFMSINMAAMRTKPKLQLVSHMALFTSRDLCLHHVTE